VTSSGLRLTVAALPENLAVVRQAVAGFAEGVGFDDSAISDLKTITTEACMNAVVHAYPDGEAGSIEVLAEARPADLEVVVRDRGTGFQPRPATPEEDSLRIGLPLIAALSDGFAISGGPDGGTEVRMRLDYERASNGAEPSEMMDAPDTVGTKMTIPPGEVARPVLSRVIGALAARIDFSIDRLSDTVLLSDAVSTHDASDFHDEMAQVTILDGDGKLDVIIGPLVPGASERILGGVALPGGTSLRKLATDVEISHESGDAGDAEFLHFVIEP
jgi:anti-sigma regulatory factor (Ser/Thr protein kinase)